MSTVAPTTQTETNRSTRPTLDAIAVVLTFRQTVEELREEVPTKIKWSDALTESDLRRFIYYDLIEPADVNMGTQTRWTLQNWVESLLDLTDANLNFSAKQVKTLSKYGDQLSNLDHDGTFVGRETGFANRTLGHLNDIELIEIKTDNRHKHEPTEWTLTDRMTTIRELWTVL